MKTVDNTAPSSCAVAELAELGACQALEAYRQRRLSPSQVIEDCLERIARDNPRVNAFSHVGADEVLEAAEASTRRWRAGAPKGPLDGVPVTIKDLTLTRGMPTRLGSRTTDPNASAEVDAPISQWLRDAGAIVVGKTLSPEFGWKGVTDNPLHGIARNPWDTELTPGGSSGGAGAAAALNLGMLHQGSDAGGSIRIPCSFTGTFGIKPTFGWVPQWPASAMSTLSHLGPMTRSVEDSALMMSVLAQPDGRDGYLGAPCRLDWRAPAPANLEGWRIAVSLDLGYVEVAPDIRARVVEAAAQLEALGARIDWVDPGFSDPLETFNTLWFAGASQVVEGLDEEQQAALDPGFLDIARRGAEVSLSAYLAARRHRAELTASMAEFHRRYDLLITPTLPIGPFAVGHNVPPGGPYREWMEWTPFSYPFNLTQQPAASLPCGLDDRGLPVGLHLVGPKFRDDKVMQAAQLLQARLPRLTPPAMT
ncbi:amidase [Halomonas sp. V046]|uniref:amidase n=1 Tax=Halomonas sp. V046 TaxID=3459611 RepID=UPI004044FEE7